MEDQPVEISLYTNSPSVAPSLFYRAELGGSENI